MSKSKNKKNKNIRREDTWLGYRPSIIQARKNDAKKDRQEQNLPYIAQNMIKRRAN